MRSRAPQKEKQQVSWSSKGPRSKYLQITITEEELDAIEFVSSEVGSTRSSWARSVLLKELSKHGFKGPMNHPKKKRSP